MINRIVTAIRNSAKRVALGLKGQTASEEQERRLRLFESDYGIGTGWFIEDAGRRVALLTDPRGEDMFWISYRIEPLTGDPAERERILHDPQFWLRDFFERELVCRNAAFGDPAKWPIPAGNPFPEPGRVSMRALYLDQSPPTRWERFLLSRRKKRRRRAADE